MDEAGYGRYSRQTVFPRVGRDGQERLLRSTALVVGCGALGSGCAELLARAGVGALRLVDRDVLEEHNLQRQSLYDERPLREGLPKAVAAARRIGEINSGVRTEAHAADVTADNVLELFEGADVVLDGTDNWEARYLLNDAAHRTGVPWVYGGVIGATGVSMAIRPGTTACLRCVFPEPPAPGGDTCETAGVLGPAVWMVASTQAMSALRVLLGDPPPARLTTIDAWNGTAEGIELGGPAPGCPACAGDLAFLDGARPTSTRLCGRDSAQVSPGPGIRMDLRAAADRLRAVGDVRANDYLLKLMVGGHELTLFADGRAIVTGTQDESVARSLYARYIGM
jgi:adenylyltransferase/sulfurtransferase